MSTCFIERTDNDLILIGKIENGSISEFKVWGNEFRTLVGYIYRGQIENIVPGLKAAFIDIGEEKNAYMFLGNRKKFKYKKGDPIIVQVLNDAFREKGARVTDDYKLRGEYIVMLPNGKDVKISRKIRRKKDRSRLLELGNKIKDEHIGLIMRTASADASVKKIKEEYDELLSTHLSLQKEINFLPTPKRLLAISNDTINDILTHCDHLITNDKEVFLELKGMKEISGEIKYLKDFSLKYDPLLYKEVVNIFSKRIILDNGSDIVIEGTEAMTVIDVNSKHYCSSNNFEDTIWEVNKTAAIEILRQINLRDISGIIIIDFIDFSKESVKNDFINFMVQESLKYKRPVNILGFTKLGLLECTRMRTITKDHFENLEIADIWS